MEISQCKSILENYEKMTKKIYSAFSCINKINDYRFCVFFEESHPYSFLSNMSLDNYDDLKVRFKEGNVILEVYECDDDNEYYSTNYVLPEYIINNFITNDDTNCHNSFFVTTVETFLKTRVAEIEKQRKYLTEQHRENIKMIEVSTIKQKIAELKAKYGEDVFEQTP